MRIQVPSAACDVISFNGQEQLCQLICAGWSYQNEHDLVKEAGEKVKRKEKHVLNPDPKIPSKKSERRLVGRREREKKKSRLEILFSAHARSSQANILHLDPNAAKDLDLGLYSQIVSKNGSASFKTGFCFSAKFPEAKGSSS